MDLADLDSVKTAVNSILAISKKIDYVILNAGLVMGTYKKTKQNMEYTIGADSRLPHNNFAGVWALEELHVVNMRC